MTDTSETDTTTTSDADLRAAVERGIPATIAELCALVKIPSVAWAAFDPSHVQASAEAVAALARGLDVFESVEIKQAGIPGSSDLGQPAVLATRRARNGRPTVLLYAHHDVQPPGKDEEWESSPFEATVRGDRLYGRGAADDKAGVMAHIASIRALVEAEGPDFDLGLALFIEGEEEFGSRSFATFLEENREALRADAIVVADSNNWDIDTPALTIGLRGNVTFRLTVRTLDHASHSGMFGGAVPDAMLATIALLATLHDADGSVAVTGLTSHEQATPDYSEQQLRLETGLIDGVATIGRGTILSRIWSQPSITVTGIDAPSVANASNTLSPSISVRVSTRIAPGQVAADAYVALEKHLVEHAPFGAKVEIDDVDMGEPFLVDTSGWAVAEARQAMADAWGTEPVDIGVGGSIPFIADLVRVFPEAQILVTGVEDPDSRAHSPNESLHLGVFKRAVLSEALLLGRLNQRTGH
ncbi:Acetylornithine deacetylase/Succinyl-diaminopimelate desuccinylase [Cryobacterium psychrotolerans]|uniref:Acetylornithine deacetylase/Succinyl-diaminopimelate desuccinylase n=1 Tax=Cryobacterium psychrotolerans TaxID=386301 RepID=A0A1G8ZFI8_9MICO|nr:dipeptidase [Cryobacterium psychrotolerans]TFD87565.1 dipeptidase [Cryobacterium psychrotolerans]SDK13872.1 Acetylornithine deacetylase/Succinyl-diaminopimelate desuccinylase [Cryobacterium psychrotolerans]